MKCPFCGSERIKQGISWGKSAETGNIGLEYTKEKSLLPFTIVAEVYSDLCLDCKTIIRTYIKVDADKNWITKD